LTIAPPLPPTSHASDALALPPLALYPSREALFEAIQSWSKPRGYAFTVGKSKKVRSGLQKVYYPCDRCPLVRSAREDSQRETQSRGTGCLFSIIALETSDLGWEVKFRPEASFNTHNHPPNQSPAAHPSDVFPLHELTPIFENRKVTDSPFSAEKFTRMQAVLVEDQNPLVSK
jgi:hypothetical protein